MIEWCNEHCFLAFALMLIALLFAYTLLNNLLIVINNLIAALFKRKIRKEMNEAGDE